MKTLFNYFIVSLFLSTSAFADLNNEALPLPFGQPASQVLPWSAGWSNVMPFTLSGDASSYYLIYNRSTGDVHFDKIFSGGYGFQTQFSAKWGKGWTHFVPFQLNGLSYFIAYNSLSGIVHFNQFLPEAKSFQNIWQGRWGSGWSSITSFTLAGKPALLAYNATSGETHFDWILPTLNGTQTISVFQWGTGWSQMLIQELAPNDLRLFAYNAQTGLLHFDRIRPDLSGIDILQTRAIGPSFVLSLVQGALNISAKLNYLVAYHAFSGRLYAFEYNGLAFSERPRATQWASGYNILTSFTYKNLTPNDGGLLAVNSNGGARFYRVHDFSKLICKSNSSCEVKANIKLQQVDPNIPEPKYKDAKLFGCYDTSIIMSSVGMLRNQSFSSMPAANSPTANFLQLLNGITEADKYKLVIFQYDSAAAKDPFYFNKVIRDTAKGSVIRKLPKDCNIDIFRDCLAMESEYGDFAIVGFSTQTNLETADLQRSTLMGAMQIIAFNWSDNFYGIGFRRITAANSPHKMAVVGFDFAHPFGLLLNDPWTGTQVRARLVTLLASPKLTLIDSNGKAMPRWIALEFEGKPGEYNFVEHIDYGRLY